jgi:hypothetical protein
MRIVLLQFLTVRPVPATAAVRPNVSELTRPGELLNRLWSSEPLFNVSESRATAGWETQVTREVIDGSPTGILPVRIPLLDVVVLVDLSDASDLDFVSMFVNTPIPGNVYIQPILTDPPTDSNSLVTDCFHSIVHHYPSELDRIKNFLFSIIRLNNSINFKSLQFSCKLFNRFWDSSPDPPLSGDIGFPSSRTVVINGAVIPGKFETSEHPILPYIEILVEKQFERLLEIRDEL